MLSLSCFYFASFAAPPGLSPLTGGDNKKRGGATFRPLGSLRSLDPNGKLIMAYLKQPSSVFADVFVKSPFSLPNANANASPAVSLSRCDWRLTQTLAHHRRTGGF